MPTAPRDVEPRLLRAFAAVAETLHFTRAAGRLYVAQQALSRDIRRLERELGAELFVRTTRQVRLTAEGERLLPYARRVLAAYDDLAAAADPRTRPLLVDVGARYSTGQRVLDAARAAAPELELVARFHSGLTGAAAEIAAGRLDVSFGRVAGLAPGTRAGLRHELVRLEPMAVLLPSAHPLAARTEVPLAALTGETLYAADGNAATAEWTDLARELFAAWDIRLAAPFPEIDGEAEFVRLVHKHGWSVLATTEFAPIPAMTLRPLTHPVPLSPVSLTWRHGLTHPGLTALRTAARKLAREHDWFHHPPDAWLPEADRVLYGPERGVSSAGSCDDLRAATGR
ncbi:LysR family transcriptional regulator [Streptomyces sp. CMB-StM0423]|uniref:LysR family transcriptional regulator n=1 Tax=Streptomyces sp. CMB-StM0423 TaxID=2059884 RepID=UPI000C704E1E|nr:LysR family transcriptional regulator [Streptomyces sp. CMB-StM0423]AUH42768.1 LysR family transcriptional regulator [Streptomyces sp. CMB-StM0423]